MSFKHTKKMNFHGSKHRKAIFKSMIVSLFIWGHITTTKTKSKVVDRNFNQICTKIKKYQNNPVHIIRWLRQKLSINKSLCFKILENYKKVDNNRRGNLTRRFKTKLNNTGDYQYKIEIIPKETSIK